ncbi:proline dehydrogenase family protein [Nocardioides daeguensis]|uniref:Proline dehydrogenase family protein n=1 Tax=Nocardioides daeguensis TaxID=908359 RepID=A0ABP6UVF4_9ACTN|nr:proline dehydrogenase family protein [Nocardioides daeguensis]MBV6725984.1 proline dehydrogenase family protein [Nocardioides daeguensis]MCR1772500.1 proline dehydrogenase family protein [Nocardioides daeguensis]
MLDQALSHTLNRASRSARARRAVESFPITRKVVDRFVPGETTADAVAATRRLVAGGRSVTIDVLGEDVLDLAGARAMRDAYRDLLTALAESGCAAGADVSLKLSAMGQALPGGTTIATDHAAEIADAAAALGCTLTLDMEDHTTVDSTLAIGAALRVSYPSVGNVLQTNLRRTPADIADLDGTGARIRLVKGAYREPASVALQRKAEVDHAYERAIDALMASDCYPMIATHDPAMLERAVASAVGAGRDADRWEAQMLYGVRPELEQRMIDQDVRMRVYVPFGTDWYGYFMRRLAERPANVAFFLRALARR